MELLLQLQQLLAGEGCPPPPGLAMRPLGVQKSVAIAVKKTTKVFLITRFTGVTIFWDFWKEKSDNLKTYLEICKSNGFMILKYLEY